MTIKRSTKPRKPHNLGFKGKTTKLSFTKFIYYLFELNENDPPEGKRLTDEDIIESAQAEFGNRILSVRNLGNTHSSASISTMRSKYNATRPNLISLRYNDNEEPCRNYTNVVDIDHVRRRAFRYGVIDPRVFTVDEIKRVLIYTGQYPEDYGHFVLPTKELITKHPFGSLKFNPKVAGEPTLTLQELELRHAPK